MKKDRAVDFAELKDEEIVRLARQGSNEAYDFLIDKYKETAKIKSRRFYISGGDKDDVVQEGMIGIFKAVRYFDESAGVPFSSFADLCMERQIKTAISGANREKHKILNESLSLSPGGEAEEEYEGLLTGGMSGDMTSGPEDLAVLKETLNHINSISKKILSPMEAKVFSAMLQGKNYREIAEDMNKSPKSIDNAIQRIKNKIRTGSSVIDIVRKK